MWNNIYRCKAGFIIVSFKIMWHLPQVFYGGGVNRKTVKQHVHALFYSIAETYCNIFRINRTLNQTLKLQHNHKYLGVGKNLFISSLLYWIPFLAFLLKTAFQPSRAPFLSLYPQGPKDKSMPTTLQCCTDRRIMCFSLFALLYP